MTTCSTHTGAYTMLYAPLMLQVVAPKRAKLAEAEAEFSELMVGDERVT